MDQQFCATYSPMNPKEHWNLSYINKVSKRL